MVEGYREYDEGQQTYQVYKFGKLAELINAPEPKGFSFEKRCWQRPYPQYVSMITVNPASEKTSWFESKVSHQGRKKCRLAPVKATISEFIIFLAPPPSMPKEIEQG